jgi:hypothetical protein
MTDEERFWAKVAKAGPDDCWPWTGHTHPRGYGIFWLDGKNVRANRYALEQVEGPPPFEGAMSLHSCDNPPCCNPGHLRWGTGAQNYNDIVLRRGPIRGEASASATVTNEIVATIYKMRLDGYIITEIAAELGIPETTVENIYVGKAWPHLLGVDGNPTLEELKAKRKRKNPKRAHNLVVTDDIADDILRSRMAGESISAIATRLDLPRGTISPVYCGLSCKHRLGVDGNPTFDELRTVQAPNPKYKLTEDDIIEIRSHLGNGVVGADLARRYGVSRATIANIKSGKR